MTWVILFTPLISALLILFVLHPMQKVAIGVSVAACFISFAFSVALFFAPENATFPVLDWINIPQFQGFSGLKIEIGMESDHLARLMLLVVTGVGFLIHVFSIGYMAEDPGKARFFGKLSFFMFSMLGIVLANNLVMMFIFWELVGLASYLLIGFWFAKPSAAEAAKKAFIVNKIGDFGFIMGILGVWLIWGSVNFTELEKVVAPGTLATTTLTLVALGLFAGCMGKSAQFPLHVWLPDAMEGPTPVSALIHAATMVAAGVYMLCRVFFILELSPTAMEIIAYIGIGTAAFAGLIAIQQNDIKRILAYSTLSQLGYMVAAVGVGSPSSAMFHLTTHAFFKALLFLGSASVINAMHHEQDIWKMGGLFKRMKTTSTTFLIGTLALAGCIPFAGFWSKEAILGAAYEKFPIVTWVGLITAGLTSFYMFRLMGVAFFSKERSDDATHTHESSAVMVVPLLLLAVLATIGGFFPIQHFISVENEPAEHHWIMYVSIGLFAVSAISALLMYAGAKKDPLNIPLFANKFYFDELYQIIFVNAQQAWARAFTWFDRWIVDGLIVRGVGAAATVSGEILRLFQGGNLQAYVILFILGAGGLFIWAALRFIL